MEHCSTPTVPFLTTKNNFRQINTRSHYALAAPYSLCHANLLEFRFSCVGKKLY